MADEKSYNERWNKALERWNEIAAQQMSYLPAIFSGLDGSGTSAYFPQIQNLRAKGIASLPCDYTKDDIEAFLRAPYESERELRQTSEILKWTAYPYFKINKTYQDIPTYHYFTYPFGIEAEDVKKPEFARERKLTEKICNELKPDVFAHKATGEAGNSGKVFYTPRFAVDKAHGTVSHAFMQRLPQDWCTIVGYNNLSKYTVCFNMMYFMQPGTDYRQFGDLFEPYLDDFDKIFRAPDTGKVVYSSLKVNGKPIYPENLNRNGYGSPRLKSINGKWWYYVTLPAEKVWTFEIDDTTPAVASPFSGLMPTLSQQADFEAAQLTLILSPLIKIFTGEMEYFPDAQNTLADQTRLSPGGRKYYEALFNELMRANNTGGTAFYMAPVKNIKSHDFSESANANEISESFVRYSVEKAGLVSLYPVTEDVKASQVESSQKIESRFATAVIYPQVEKLMEYIFDSLNLRFKWKFKMFGTIFDDADIRENALKAITNGDISAHYVLSALDGTSVSTKIGMMQIVKESGMLDMLIPPITSYTAKQENSGLPPTGGRPKTEDMSDAKEKQTDAYGG